MPLVDLAIDDSEELLQERKQWEPVWQEISELVIPRKSNFSVKHTPGELRTRRLFDATAPQAALRLPAAIVGAIAPISANWVLFDVATPPGFLRPKSIDSWFQKASMETNQALRESSFYAELLEALQDFVAFGTGAWMIEEEGSGKLRFQAAPPYEYTFGEDFRNRPNRVYRQFEDTVRNVVHTFGIENVSEDTQRKFKEKPNEKITILHVIAKREVFEDGPRSPEVGTEKPVLSMYLEKKERKILQQGGFEEWPFPIGRWSTISSERWGRGPGYIALPDVQSLNRAEELGLRATAMAILPPVAVLNDTVLGNLDLRPSRITRVKNPDGIRFLTPESRFDVTAVNREDKRRSIWQIFYMDQIQFVPGQGKTPATATEVNALLQIMLQILGPTLGRFDWEFLTPTIGRVFRILLRSGRIPPPPPELMQLIQASGNSLGVEFVGPIARASRQSHMASVLNVLSTVQGMAAVVPEVIDNIDTDEAVRLLVQFEGAPTQLMNSRKVVKAIRDRRSELQQAQQQDQAILGASEAIRNAGPTLTQQQ